MLDDKTQMIIHHLKGHVGLIVTITLLFTLVGVGVTLVLPRQYKAESRVALIPSSTRETDAYTAQRAIESDANLLIDLVYTDEFFNRFVGEDLTLQQQFSMDDVEDRRKEFRRNVIVDTSGRGFISVLTYNKQEDIALTMNEAVVTHIKKNGENILGEKTSISIVDDPMVFDRIGRPNIFLNLSGAAVVGLAAGITYVLLKKTDQIHSTVNPSVSQHKKSSLNQQQNSWSEVDEFGFLDDDPYEL